MTDLVGPIVDFLGVATPSEWLEAAPNHLDILLIDHAHCEKKAAATALNLLFRYVDRPELLSKLSQLAREELLHFDQVLGHIQYYGMTYIHLSPSRYAHQLRVMVRPDEPERLIDVLIIGALIEARSCERFAALSSVITEDRLSKYYRFLLASEARHFEDYLALAKLYAVESIEARIEEIREVENHLILSPDAEFRFHSGVPS